MLNQSELEKTGERIRQEREKLNLSREKLSKLIGISAYHIGQIERGERNMSVTTLIEISRTFHVSLDYIVFGKVETEKKENETEINEIVDLLKRCSDKEVMLISDITKLILPHLKK